jgi:hypothetical protein
MGFLTVKLNKVFDHGVPNHFFLYLKTPIVVHFVPEKVRCILCRAVGAAGTAI